MLLNGYGSTFKKQNRRGWFILRIVNIPIFGLLTGMIHVRFLKTSLSQPPRRFKKIQLNPILANWIPDSESWGFYHWTPKIPGVAQWYPHDIATSTSGLDRRTWGAPRVVAVLADHDHLQWGSILFFAQQLMQLWMWSYTVYIIYTNIMHIYICICVSHIYIYKHIIYNIWYIHTSINIIYI